MSELVAGNRGLLVGDSILASAAPRNDGDICDALVLFGWAAEVDAVSARGIDFGSEVLDARLGDEEDQQDDWDVVALSFGSDVDGTLVSQRWMRPDALCTPSTCSSEIDLVS